MKKKVLTALFAALFVCLFAFAVSAANEVTFVDGTKADLETVFSVENSTVKGFNSGYSKENIKDVLFPDYITTIKSVSFASSTVIETVTFEASESLVLDNVSFSQSSVKKVTFNPDCVLNYKSGSFYSCKSLTEITFPKFEALTGNCFHFNSNMVSTNNIVFVDGVETIKGHIFDGCSKVGGTIVFPASLKEIKEYTFAGTSITSFDFSKCVNLTKLGGGYGNTFANIDTITSYDFSACVNLTIFDGPCMFEGSAELTNIILPPNLTKIPHKTLAHCYKMQSIVIPASVTYIADESFHSVRRGQDVMTFTMYIQSNVEFCTKYVFRDTSAKIELVLLGNSVTAAQFKATNEGVDIIQSGKSAPINNIEVVNYLDPQSPWTFVPGQARTSHVIVENYCTNLALNGEHKSNDNPCVIYCADCKLSAAKDNPQHKETISFVYVNGYANPGEMVTSCANEGCTHKVTTPAQALFVCLGYSASSYGKGGVVVGYDINYEAISNYETITGKTVKYGVFAVKKDTLGQNEVFGENGEAANGVIKAEITGRGTHFNAFEIKVSGFTDENKDTKFAMGAYVSMTKDNVTEYSYMQDSIVGEAVGNYYFATYNEILKITSSK